MNRTIKFRGRHLSTGEWIYGSYVHDIEWAKHYIFTQKLIGAFYQLSQIKVSEEEIGQYTGLKDKNGKEIYEGDIILHGESVRFIEYRWSNFCATRMDKTCTLLLSFSKDPEVIGNIYENPELLKHETKSK